MFMGQELQRAGRVLLDHMQTPQVAELLFDILENFCLGVEH